jgi:hypothetical protein
MIVDQIVRRYVLGISRQRDREKGTWASAK